MKKKVIRISTVSLSLDVLLKGQLSFLNKQFEIIAVSGQDRHLEVVAKREKVRTVSVKMTRKVAPLKDLISLINLFLLFKKEKPQIVHSFTPKAGVLSMMAAYLAHVPIRIHTFTGLIFPARSGVMQRWFVFMDKLVCSCATNIYPEGEGVKNDLISYKITNKPLQVLANGNINGIDTNFFDANLFSLSDNAKLKKKIGIQPDDFVFLFVGRVVGDKGINELVAAFTKLSSTNVKLLLVGQCEEEFNPLQEQTKATIKHNKKIISVGFKNDVRSYFAIADVLVFPSYREGFPNVVMQSGAMGLPSIVSNINGCNEIIIEGVNGWIIPAKDKLALFKAMQNCLTNIEEVKKLSENSRNLIVNRFGQKLVWQAMLSEYKSLVQNI